jgi:hypothetical protein
MGLEIWLKRGTACIGYLPSMTPFDCFARKLNEPEAKEHSREKPV